MKLVVSNGKKEETATVPDLRGMTESAAKDKLTSEGFKVGTVTEAYSDTVTAGCVISQTANPGSEVAKGSSVGFQLSAGPEKKSYKFVTTLNAPTGYTGGNVTITITGSDGTVRNFTTASFPCAVNENTGAHFYFIAFAEKSNSFQIVVFHFGIQDLTMQKHLNSSIFAHLKRKQFHAFRVYAGC